MNQDIQPGVRNRTLLGLVWCLLLFLSSCTSSSLSSSDYSILVVNESSSTICKIQTTPSSPQPIFLGNHLGRGILEPGEDLLIDGLKKRHTAIQAESCENNQIAAVDYDVDLASESQFIVTDSNLIDWRKIEFPTPQPRPTAREPQQFYLDNSSEYSLCSLQIAFRSSSPRFGTDLLQGNVLYPGDQWGPLSVEYATYILRIGLCDGRSIDVDDVRIWTETHFSFDNNMVSSN